MVFFVPILYALGGIAIRAAAPAAARALLSLGAKKITTEAAKKLPGAIITATPKVLKQLKKVGPKGGPKAKPKGKVTTKPKEKFGPGDKLVSKDGGSTFKIVAKPNTKQPSQFGPGGVTVKPTPAKPPAKQPSQFGPGGVTVKPTPAKPKPNAVKPKPKKPTKVKPGSSTSGGKAKKGGLKTKKRKSPFAKETKAQTAARIKKEKIQDRKSKDSNINNPSRDPKGKYAQRPLKTTNVPKSGAAKKGGLKSRLDAKAKKAAAGLGIAAVKVDNLSQEELKIKKLDKGKSVSNKTGSNTGSRGSEGNRFKGRTMKKPLPIVKAPQGPSKVRPKESDQPKKKTQTFAAAFNEARREKKQPTFTWKNPKTGKTGTYTTRLKEESIKDHKKKFGVTGKY